MDDLTFWIENSFGKLDSIEPLAGDASCREFYRIHSSGDVFVAMDSSRTPLWPWLDIHKLLSEMNFPVPEIVLCNEKMGYVLQEDIGDCRLLDVEDQDDYLRYLHKSLSLLRRLQREITPEKSSVSIAGRRYFTSSFFMAEMEHTLEHLFFTLLKVPVEELVVTQKLLRDLCDRAMESESTVFTHRDYHSANLMIKDDAVYLLDWQDARQGPACYDLASILRDSYRDSGDQWRGMAQAHILGINGANLFQFVFSALQRNLKAMGTFAYQYRALGNDTYLNHIPRTLRYLEDYSKVCPAVAETVDNLIRLVDKYTGQIDLRDFRDSDNPLKTNL